MAGSWTPKTIPLIGTMPDGDLAKQLGITRTAVRLKRLKMKIQVYAPEYRMNWGATELGLFRCFNDAEIAKMTNRSLADVQNKRKSIT